MAEEQSAEEMFDEMVKLIQQGEQALNQFNRTGKREQFVALLDQIEEFKKTHPDVMMWIGKERSRVPGFYKGNFQQDFNKASAGKNWVVIGGRDSKALKRRMNLIQAKVYAAVLGDGAEVKNDPEMNCCRRMLIFMLIVVITMLVIAILSKWEIL